MPIRPEQDPGPEQRSPRERATEYLEKEIEHLKRMSGAEYQKMIDDCQRAIDDLELGETEKAIDLLRKGIDDTFYDQLPALDPDFDSPEARKVYWDAEIESDNLNEIIEGLRQIDDD